jgi:hypothetical protein
VLVADLEARCEVTEVELDDDFSLPPVLVGKEVVAEAVLGQLRLADQQAGFTGVGALHDQSPPLDSHLVPHGGELAITTDRAMRGPEPSPRPPFSMTTHEPATVQPVRELPPRTAAVSCRALHTYARTPMQGGFRWWRPVDAPARAMVSRFASVSLRRGRGSGDR